MRIELAIVDHGSVLTAPPNDRDCIWPGQTSLLPKGVHVSSSTHCRDVGMALYSKLFTERQGFEDGYACSVPCILREHLLCLRRVHVDRMYMYL